MAERNPGPGREDGRDPVDEDAAWAAIVAAYGEEPADPAPSATRSAAPYGDADAADDRDGKDRDDGDQGQDGLGGTARPLGSSITVFSAGIGPRDWSAPEPSEDDFDESDEGHFVPPEPPPLPQGDTTAKFAWLAVLGGPLLLLLTVLLQWNMTWWIATLGVGGFLGGFATLVARMKDGGDEDDDPGRGAVV